MYEVTSKRILLLSVVSITIFVVMFMLVGWKEVGAILYSIEPTLLGFAILIYFITVYIRSVRWSYLLNKIGFRIDPVRLLPFIIIGLFGNNITPGAKIGGEPVRAYFLKMRFKLRISEGMATIITERLMDFIVMFLFGAVGLFFVISKWNLPPKSLDILIIFLLIVFIILLILTAALLDERVLYSIGKFIPRKFRSAGITRLFLFHDNFKLLMKSPSTLIFVFICTLLNWSLELFRIWIILLALNNYIPIEGIATAYTLSIFVGGFSFLPGGLGILEASIVILFAIIGLSVKAGVALALVDRLIHYWMILGIGSSMMPYFGIKEIDRTV
ncbi:MAG: lysylphosphatidylglycerol synthase transmembrane domain-containing protein [Candidatus Hydrothermarchaeota archaeon]